VDVTDFQIWTGNVREKERRLEQDHHKGHDSKRGQVPQQNKKFPPEHHQLLPIQHNTKPDDPTKNVNC
jgi:hypothetical protein